MYQKQIEIYICLFKIKMTKQQTQTEIKAREILNYMVKNLAEGVYIKPKYLKEYLEEICFIIDNS